MKPKRKVVNVAEWQRRAAMNGRLYKFVRERATRHSDGGEVMDEFVNLKELVENLRSSLPPLKERQYQLIGLYLLAALRLGKGAEDYHQCIDDYHNRPGTALRVVKP
jgi:hypothetical protein